MRKRSRLDFQKCEERRCLTVVAGLTDGGALWVAGEADGPVEIVAQGEQTFQVLDNGEEVAVVEGVTTNMRVNIDGRDDVPSNDRLRINLGDQNVDNIAVRLGGGDNNMAVTGDNAVDRFFYFGGDGADQVLMDLDTEFMTQMLMRGGDDSIVQTADANRIRIRGGDGNDSVLLDADSTVGVMAVATGDGADRINLQGDVETRLHIHTGDGADRVSIGETADVSGPAAIGLGNGHNRLNMAGTVAGSMAIRSGVGSDVVNMESTASVGRHLGIVLGGQSNLRIAGSVGQNVFFRGLAGNDHFRIGESAQIGGDVRGLMGEGDNQFQHFGAIDGNLFIVSKNADDAFSVDGTVEGRIFLGPGDQR